MRIHVALDPARRQPGLARFFRAPQTWLGLICLAIFWPLNWLLPGVRTAYLFFPLWLGYIVTMDSAVHARTGASLLHRAPWHFAGLFVCSAPAWWLFEWINKVTRNWEYLGAEMFGPIQYFILSTIAFSTVMPAVFETAEWVRTFYWVNAIAARRGFALNRTRLIAIFLSGAAMLNLTLSAPKTFYPFVWISLVLILEPLNCALGRPALLRSAQSGDWRPIIALSLGALFCGFFWELWNYDSFPKWIYHTPGANFWHLFEMPLLGYGGYLPFAWELFALRSLLWPNPPPLRI